MPEGASQRPPEAQSEEIPQITADDLDQNLETNAEGQAAPDLQMVEDQGEIIAEPPETGTEDQEISPEILETETDDPENEDKEKQTRERRVGIKKRLAVRRGLRPIYGVAETGEFNNEQVLKFVDSWIEKNDADPENIAEILKYFELAKEIISSEFPPDRRVEIICALAEILAEGHMDAESLALLVSKIEPEKQDTSREDQVSGYKGIAFFREASDERGARITLTESFFEQDEAGARKYNLAHMLKHEVGHGLISYGEILSGEEMAAINSQIKNREAHRQTEMPKISAEIYRILDQARSDRHLQTHHLSVVLGSYEALKHREGVTEAEIQQRTVMAANQIMAEKTGLYLSSNGEFADFLWANIEVTSDENLQRIFETSEKPEIKKIIEKIISTDGEEQQEQIKELRHDCPQLVRFVESNKVFFDLASERLSDKAALKEKIGKNVARGAELGDDEEDFFGYYEQGFYEPGTPVQTNQSGQSKEQRENFWGTALELAGAIGGEMESVTLISEITRSKAA